MYLVSCCLCVYGFTSDLLVLHNQLRGSSLRQTDSPSFGSQSLGDCSSLPIDGAPMRCLLPC